MEEAYVLVTKLTDVNLMRKACEFTTGKISNVHLLDMYCSEHSPCRTQLFWIEMYHIPTFVSVHLVRHKVGVEHFVSSNREDRGGYGNADRNTPVNHAMLINAQALMTMARSRLCNNAHPSTRKMMQMIKEKMFHVDNMLAANMLPKCEYRNGRCDEFRCCGHNKTIERQ